MSATRPSPHAPRPSPLASRPPNDVLAIGDLNIDLILGVNGLPEFGREVLAHSIAQHSGGVAANLAAYCARLGLKVALLARVGRDRFGDFLIAEMLDKGVVTDHIIRDERRPTGITVSLSGPADRAFVTHVGTIDSLTGADATDELLASARLVHLGSYFLQTKLQPDVPDLLRRAKAAGAITVLDTGYDPYERWDTGVHEALRRVDLFLPNKVEATQITGKDDPLVAQKKLVELGPAVALKLGAQGARFLSATDEAGLGAFAVSVVDSTCCGDAFDAGFLSAWLKGKRPQECLAWGNACGALVASGEGNAAEKVSVAAVEAVLLAGAVR